MASLFERTANAEQPIPENTMDVRYRIRKYIVDNLLLGIAADLDDGSSLSESGFMDSTGAMELVAFLEQEFPIRIADQELVAANLDSINRIVALVERKTVRV